MFILLASQNKFCIGTPLLHSSIPGNVSLLFYYLTLAKGFRPLAKDFALLANHLIRIFTEISNKPFFFTFRHLLTCKGFVFVYLLTSQLTNVFFGMLANKINFALERRSCIPAVQVMCLCFFYYLTLAKGFRPIAKDFALLANHLIILFTEISNKPIFKLYTFSHYLTCEGFVFVYMLTNQLANVFWSTC